MYQASTQYDTAILEDGRTFRAKITIGTEEITDGFRSIKQSARSCGGDYITIGGAVSSCVEVEMWAPSVPLKNQEFDLSIGLVAEGETEWVPIGKFTAPDPKDNDGILTFTAYDRIWSKMSGAYFSELTYPADGKAVLAEMAAKTGVPIKTDNLPDGVMIPKREVVSEATVDEEGNETTNITYATPFDGYTYREALGYIAQFYGKIATANRSGEVELRWYTETDCELRANQYYDDLTKSEQVFSVDSIVCQVGNSTLKVGTGTESISIENPVMAQERLQAVYDQVKDLQYLPASLSFFGDPRLDLCDIVRVYDKAGNLIRLPVMRLVQDFDGGLITQLQSFGGAEQESAQQKGPTAQALDRTYSELFLVKELIGDKASISYVRANFADITLANIDTANINKAKVRDLFTEVGLIKQAVISEGHITGYLDSVQVNAASITAGTLVTDRLLLRGSTGSIVYALNNFGELTSTQVNTIDGYILTDRTVNADKIIAHSITAYEITVENLIGANGWINLAQGTFNYGDALIWDGNQLTVSGVVTASGGAIGGFSLGDRYIESTATISGTTYRGWLEKNSGLSTNYFWGVQVNGTSKAYVRYDGYFYANNANITGDITATSLTAQNVYYLHDSAGTKKAVLASSDLEFRDNAPVVNIGTGFTYVNIKNNLFANGQLMVGANGGGHLWCGNFYGGGIEIVNSSITGANSLTANGNIKSNAGGWHSFYALGEGTNQPGFCCENAGRKGVFYVSSSYALGIYDATNGGWVFYSDTNQKVNIPHLLCSYNEGYTTLRPVIGTNAGTNAIGVIVSNASTVGFYGRWGGGATAAMSGRTISCPSSDIRLKDNVQQSEVDALSVINQIQMRQFDWKDRQEHWDVGFVADELEKIDPLLSIGGGTDDDGNPMYKSVNDFYLLGYLTKAVQELSAENARLKKRVSHLEAA